MLFEVIRFCMRNVRTWLSQDCILKMLKISRKTLLFCLNIWKILYVLLRKFTKNFLYNERVQKYVMVLFLSLDGMLSRH